MKNHFEKMSISQRLVWLYTLAAAAVLILLFLAFEYVERKEIDMYQRAEITSRFAIMEHIIEDKASRADWKDFKEQIQEFTPPSGGTIIRSACSFCSKTNIAVPYFPAIPPSIAFTTCSLPSVTTQIS